MKFAQILTERKLVFRKECAHVQNIISEFDFLDINGIGGENVNSSMKTDLFTITHEVPKLTQEKKRLGFFCTVKKLTEEAKCLNEIDKKNEINQTLIDDFIVQIRENYIEGKGDAMEQKRREFRFKKDGTKVIDSTSLTHDKAMRFKTETEGFVAKQEDLYTDNIKFREQIKEAKRKIDYWLDCIIWHGWFTCVFAVVWIIFFAVPYIWIQHRDLNYYQYGMHVFYSTMGIIGIAFWGSFFYFRHAYKSLIKTEIQRIINEFNRVQDIKEENAQTFKSRLTHFYPRSEVLQSYYEEVVDYIKEEEKLSFLKDYHKRYLRGYSDEYIEKLLVMLDIKNLVGNVQEPDPATFIYRLDINSVKKSVPELFDLDYLLNMETVKQVLGGTI